MCSGRDGNELLRAIKKGRSRRKLTRYIKPIMKDFLILDASRLEHHLVGRDRIQVTLSWRGESSNICNMRVSQTEDNPCACAKRIAASTFLCHKDINSEDLCCTYHAQQGSRQAVSKTRNWPLELKPVLTFLFKVFCLFDCFKCLLCGNTYI